MRVIIPRNKTPRRESSREQQMRVENEKKLVAKQAAVIDVHDLLHSIFWGKPTRQELNKVRARMDEQLEAHKISQMDKEINELMGMGLTKLGKGEKYDRRGGSQSAGDYPKGGASTNVEGAIHTRLRRF